jgi:hypothetical protein
MNGHHQFDLVASTNIGGQVGRAGDKQVRIQANGTPASCSNAANDSCCDGFLLHRSRASLWRPQCFSFRDGSNTRSTVGLEPSSRRSEQTWWGRRDRRRVWSDAKLSRPRPRQKRLPSICVALLLLSAIRRAPETGKCPIKRGTDH